MKKLSIFICVFLLLDSSFYVSSNRNKVFNDKESNKHKFLSSNQGSSSVHTVKNSNSSRKLRIRNKNSSEIKVKANNPYSSMILDQKPSGGHYEKVTKKVHQYVWVSGNAPSGIPGSYVVSEDEALGPNNRSTDDE
mmetsp:Transcript_7109/g.7355  ORF Transcript_7109/g.7355 Transcript_7109/m.7355 type:complete len:136 (-) Transcript_7109:69-476(-)